MTNSGLHGLTSWIRSSSNDESSGGLFDSPLVIVIVAILGSASIGLVVCCCCKRSNGDANISRTGAWPERLSQVTNPNFLSLDPSCKCFFFWVLHQLIVIVRSRVRTEPTCPGDGARRGGVTATGIARGTKMQATVATVFCISL